MAADTSKLDAWSMAGSIEAVAPALRVLLVDDVAAFRAAARAYLQAMSNVLLVGEAGSGREAVEQVERLLPDVVLMDIHMAGGSGLEAARALRARNWSPQIVLFSLQADDAMRRAALAAGADDFFPKNDFAQSVGTSLTRIVGERMQTTGQPTRTEVSDTASYGLVGAVLELNNLLQEIMTKAALGQRKLPSDHPAYAILADVEVVGARVGVLVRRLVGDGKARPTED
jgi:DNA-binding NarL/FixJ family response regulator